MSYPDNKAQQLQFEPKERGIYRKKNKRSEEQEIDEKNEYDDYKKSSRPICDKIRKLGNIEDLITNQRQIIESEIKAIDQPGEKNVRILTEISELCNCLIEPEDSVCFDSIMENLRLLNRENHKRSVVFTNLISVKLKVGAVLVLISSRRAPWIPTVRAALEKIDAIYTSFIDKILNTSDIQKRLDLVTGPAKLIGLDVESIKLDSLTAKRLAPWLFPGYPLADVIKRGANPVIKLNGMYFTLNPDCLGIGYAVAELNYLINGIDPPPSILLKLKYKGDTHILLASQATEGDNLSAVLKDEPERLDSLDLSNYSAMIALSLLIDPGNAKAENFLVVPQTPAKRIHLQFLSNDIAFLDPIIYDPLTQSHRVAILNFLYTLPEIEQSVNEEWKSRFLSLKAERVVLLWLVRLMEMNKTYERYVDKKIISPTELTALNLPLKLVRGTALSLYWKIRTIQRVLRSSKEKITLQDLVRTIEPIVAAVYANARQITKEAVDLESAFEIVYKSIGNPVKMPEGSAESILRLPSPGVAAQISPFARQGIIGPKQPFEKDRTEPIQNELEDFIANIPFEDLSQGRQEGFFPELGKAKQIQVLKFNGAKYLTEDHLIKFENLIELHLDGADRIGVDCLLKLVRAKPALKLVLGENKSLDRKAWLDIVKAGGNLWLLIENGQSIQIHRHPEFTDEILATGRVDIVQLLVELGADPKKVNESKQTILHRLSRMGDEKLIELFLQLGLDPLAKDKKGRIVIHTSALARKLGVTKFWVEQGMDVNAKDKHKATPLFHAVGAGDENTVPYLIEKKADIEGSGCIHHAAEKGHTTILELLLQHTEERKKALELKGKQGGTPLHFAAKQPNVEMVKFLIKEGARLDAVDDSGNAPLHWAAHFNGQSFPENIKELLMAKADPKIKNHESLTPLDIAINLEQDEVVIAILRPVIFPSESKQEPPVETKTEVQSNPQSYYNQVAILIGLGLASLKEAETSKHPSGSSDNQTRLSLGDQRGRLSIVENKEVLNATTFEIYHDAAMYYNQALAIAQNQGLNESLIRFLLGKLGRIEAVFASRTRPEEKYVSHVEENRKALAEIRMFGIAKIWPKFKNNTLSRYIQSQLKKFVFSGLQEMIEAKDNKIQAKDDIFNIQEEMTAKFIEFVKAIFQQTAYQKIGPTGTELNANSFAIVGLGPMACCDMLPYSGIEIAVLLDSKEPELIEHFRQVLGLFYLKVINLGETNMAVGPHIELEDTKAFHVASPEKKASVTPQGFRIVWSLIGTPEELADLQLERENLTPASYLLGNQKLLDRSTVHLSKLLNESGSRPSRAMRSLRAVVEKKMGLNLARVQGKKFNVKHDIYEFFVAIIRNLALYHDISATRTIEMVYKLSGRVFWKDPSRLAFALRLLTHLRFRLQFLYGSERYDLVHDGAPCLDTGKFEIMDEEAIAALNNIYQVLRPLVLAAKNYVNSSGKETQLDTGIAPFPSAPVLERKRDYRSARTEYLAMLCIGQHFEIRQKLYEVAIKAVAEEGLSQLRKKQDSPFLGRNDRCKEIKAQLPQNSKGIQVVTLTGESGIGKTRLAIEYALQESKNYEFIWFVDATDRKRSLNELAEALTIGHPTEQDVEQKLLDWLEHRPKRWLIIYDNAINSEATLIPKTGGDVIITSPRSDWKVPIALTSLGQNAAISLLEGITKNRNPGEAAQLIKSLGTRPFDLVMAGSVISKERISYGEYLKRIVNKLR